jgi:hypothetical protein
VNTKKSGSVSGSTPLLLSFLFRNTIEARNGNLEWGSLSQVAGSPEDLVLVFFFLDDGLRSLG